MDAICPPDTRSPSCQSWRKAPGRRGRLSEAEQRLVDVDAAAKMLGVSTNYAYKMIRASDLSAVDLGKCILVKVVEIDALIERKTAQPRLMRY
jgi:excisionase family DNA binding protein